MYNVSRELLAAISTAETLTVAAPYIKADALIQLLTNLAPTAQLVCITRWKPQDLALGASDLECRQIVLDQGGQFLLHPTLHAKYYRFDETILIGSANLTLSGMGWRPRANTEILTSPSDAFDHRAFESELLGRARPVSDAEYEYWAAVPIGPIEPRVERQQVRQQLNWRPVTREFENLARAYYGRLSAIPSSDEARRAQGDIAALGLQSNLLPDALRRLVTTSLLASPYASDVLRVQHMDAVDAARELATSYDLPLHLARRDMETVHNWLRELAPELLPSSENQ